MATRADIGEFSFGAQTAYGTRDKVMGIGLNAKYNFSHHSWINLLADYYFKKNLLVTVEGQEEVADTTKLVFEALAQFEA